ncbi:tau-tubulin kinase like protein Asator [Ditylenchus destructor]|uniref:Tau-tubulin kinase like protein Asator n=1 Tax=Ditylenchus destructor TaxID=166010 RepID=A0AAD4N1W1_9BILA|nr:tau-tubulin kinase like protein Asator [Ditylenchus destructor]
MGQNQAKTAAHSASKVGGEAQTPLATDAAFMGEIAEVSRNVAGIFDSDFLITAPMDDLMERDFCFYHVDNFEEHDRYTIAAVARPEAKRVMAIESMNNYYKVLSLMQDRSYHVPKLERAGAVPKLVFGHEGEQQLERDPEWTSRPTLILSMTSHPVMLGALSAFSPTGCLPTSLALTIGVGLCRAIAALHRAGYVHRLVTPFSFAVCSPISVTNLASRILHIDFSLAKEWPLKPLFIYPFTGSLKYASLRVHHLRGQEPADDIISIIYVIAEMIAGKLPWRSVKEQGTIKKLKSKFHKSPCYKMLPTEIRALYSEMMRAEQFTVVDHSKILDAFRTAIERKYPEGIKLPPWLTTPTQ